MRTAELDHGVLKVEGLVIEQIAYHRNGVSGEPFHVVLFMDPEEEARMIGIVFDEPGHVAVFNRRLLAKDEIAFAVNSWRGDHYASRLRLACEAADALHCHADGLVYRAEASVGAASEASAD